MPLEAPALPTRFPCWCRAVYSWGGETNRDLGFIEGDLIECLNAGDGQWWTGRLRRDRRMVGMFPSNFVQVLGENFRPTSRSTSPMPERTPSPYDAPPLQKSKSKPFRKPFTAYAAPDEAAIKRAEAREREAAAMRARAGSRAASPNPMMMSPTALGSHEQIHRVPSPQINGYGSRVASPAPSFEYRPYSRGPPSRGPSPSPFQGDVGSSPPPPPPPHKHIYSTPHSSTNSRHQDLGHLQSRQPSPCPPSPGGGGSGMTPSPLRSAMEDVMSSLQGMSGLRETESPEAPLNPWSPEAFDEALSRRSKRQPVRPNTSMGIAGQYDEDEDDEPYQTQNYNPYEDAAHRPQLSNYVERMESRLKKMHETSQSDDRVVRARSRTFHEESPPDVPPKMHQPRPTRPVTSSGNLREQALRNRNSAYDVGRKMIGRTFTTKTNSTTASSGGKSTITNTSSSTSATDRSLMSGYSAGGMSATSAGSLQRRKDALYGRAQSALGMRKELGLDRPETPISGVTYHSSHASDPPRSKSQAGYRTDVSDSAGMFGGLVAPPKPKKSSFFKKMFESAKTSAASARSNIAMSDASRPLSRGAMRPAMNGISGGSTSQARDTAKDMGLGGGGTDWVHVRRDVNRSNSLSRIERVERKERCQMMDHPAFDPVEELYSTLDGDEAANGIPVTEPMNFQSVNLSMVDKNTRFIKSLPPLTNPLSLATGFVCRPYRSDIQRLRAIFTWVSEMICWEEDVDDVEVDPKRTIQTKRGTAEDVSVLVMEMCAAMGIQAEVVRGYLKSPGEVPELGIIPRSNHFWNTVIVDGEWRIIDCSLASPSNPKRGAYSFAGQYAESWWFLARPSEICWTHIPEHPQQQHLCPPQPHDVLLALPCACPPFFKNTLEMVDYDTSLIRIEDLEVAQIRFSVPADVECAAEVEAKSFVRDADGDYFESGDTVKKRALAQAEWVGGRKRYTVKALLPGDEGQGILKIYAGKRGLMQSIKDIPHPIALALPIIHTGENPPYDFLTRHPTPHAQRHDLYVAQPQCYQLAMNNTFVFAIRQHPSSLVSSPNPGNISPPAPFKRPSSAMSISASSNSSSNPSTFSSKKPAKLAIQSPGGKILRLIRKEERGNSTSQGVEPGDGGTWETIIKCGERGIWRGLVLADRTARWCVFAEWNCV